jgi:hypothetical protein
MLAGAALGFSGCSQDYALFKVHLQLQTANGGQLTPDDLASVAYCQMSITDENNEAVLTKYKLNTGVDSSGNFRGCYTSKTPSDVGFFSYSTSRTSGSLTFSVTSYDDTDKQLETGTSTPAQVKPFHVAADEIPVSVIAK